MDVLFCYLMLKLIFYMYFDLVCEDGVIFILKEVFNFKRIICYIIECDKEG